MRRAVSGLTELRALFPVDRKKAMVDSEHLAASASFLLLMSRYAMYCRKACLLMSRTQSLPLSKPNAEVNVTPPCCLVKHKAL